MDKEIKDLLLKAAKDAAVIAVNLVFDIAVQAIKKSKTTLDDAMLPVLDTAKVYILSLTDNIVKE